MKRSDLNSAYFLNKRLTRLEQMLQDVDGGASLLVKVPGEENSIEILFDPEHRQPLLWEFLRAEIKQCKRELAALGVEG